MIKEKHIVACYGTLMKDFENHGCLRNSKMIGQGKTADKMIMTASGIPFVSKKKEEDNIHVEVYEVNDDVLYRLDCLEGHPSFYKREVTDINLTDGTKAKAWMYFYDRMNGEVVKDGNYRNYRKNY